MRVNPGDLKFTIPGWIVERWSKIAYLIINPNIKDIASRFKMEPSAKFHEAVAKYLNEYMYENKMPPEEIAPAILNMADDLMAGRQMQIRAGDYIMIQGFTRKG